MIQFTPLIKLLTAFFTAKTVLDHLPTTKRERAPHTRFDYEKIKMILEDWNTNLDNFGTPKYLTQQEFTDACNAKYGYSKTRTAYVSLIQRNGLPTKPKIVL